MDKAKQRTDAEWLSAFIDGELDAGERAIVEARLAREPAFAEKLEQLSNVNQAVQKAFGEISDEPLPESITALLDENSSDAIAPSDHVVKFPRRPRKHFYVPASLAAAITLAVGVFFAAQLNDISPTGINNLSAGSRIGSDSPLYSLLQSTPSAVRLEFDGGAFAEARFSFATADDRWCRQAIVNLGGDNIDFVACHGDDRWMVEVVAASPTGSAPSGDVYITASRAPAAIDKAVDRIIDGAPVGRDAEQELIAKDWPTRQR